MNLLFNGSIKLSSMLIDYTPLVEYLSLKSLKGEFSKKFDKINIRNVPFFFFR